MASAATWSRTCRRRSGAEIYNLLYTMLGAGVGVLLIACVNVSNLLVARGSLRQREVAVRMALGAARARVIRQHLTEVLVLAAAGAGLGILISIARHALVRAGDVGSAPSVLDHLRTGLPGHAVRARSGRARQSLCGCAPRAARGEGKRRLSPEG